MPRRTIAADVVLLNDALHKLASCLTLNPKELPALDHERDVARIHKWTAAHLDLCDDRHGVPAHGKPRRRQVPPKKPPTKRAAPRRGKRKRR